MGSELACALGKRGISILLITSVGGWDAVTVERFLPCSGKDMNMEINQIIPEKGNMAKVLPEYLSQWATNKIKDEGVNVITNAELKSVKEAENNKIELSFGDGSKVVTDHVVLAIGLDPNTELAKSSGLEIDDKHGGYRVNAELEARTNLWVVSV